MTFKCLNFVVIVQNLEQSESHEFFVNGDCSTTCCLKRISKSAQHCNFDHPDQESMRLALAVISNPSWMSQSIEKKWTKENFEEGMAFAKLLETLKAEKELTTRKL